MRNKPRSLDKPGAIHRRITSAAQGNLDSYGTAVVGLCELETRQRQYLGGRPEKEIQLKP